MNDPVLKHKSIRTPPRPPSSLTRVWQFVVPGVRSAGPLALSMALGSSPLLVPGEVVHLVHQEGQQDVREGAASGLVREEVLGDGEERRVLQGGVEEDRDVPTHLSVRAKMFFFAFF